MKLILAVLITTGTLASCSEQVDQLSERDLREKIFEANLKKDCLPNLSFYGGLCQNSVNDKRTCYRARGRSAYAIDCTVYDEMKKVLDGMDSK